MQFGGDTTPPMLLSFDVNLETGVYFLSFDETVDISSYIDQLTLQSASSLATQYALTTSTPTTGNSTVVSITLSEIDLNSLKACSVCISKSTFYILYTSQLIADMPVQALSAGSAMQVNNYTADTTGPSLLYFARFDLNSAELVPNFSESINASSIMLNAITLQSFYRSTEDRYVLTSGAVSDSGPSITITLSMNDAVNLEQHGFLCARIGTYWLPEICLVTV